VGASYDSTRDVLWVAINRTSDWLVYLENAAHGGSTWRASPSLPSVSAQTILMVPAVGKLYTAGYGQLFVTSDQGATWRNLMNHSWEEQIYSLFYDELVVCSQLGLQGVTDDQVTSSCSLKTPGYRGKKVVLPKKFTFKVQYSGSQATGELQSRRGENASWRKLGNLKFKNSRAALKKVISRSQQVRASMADCVSGSVMIKGKKR